MNILMVSSEVTPFAKSGGLADVVSSLSIELNKAKINTRVLLPYYKDISDKEKWTKTKFSFDFELWGKKDKITIYEKVYQDVIFHSISHPLFSLNNGLYGENSFSPYSNNFSRFYLLNLIALNYEKICGFKVDIYHCNDWQTGLLPMLLKLNKSKAKSVFTIHNLAYQGVFPRFDAMVCQDFDSTLFDSNNNINLMRCALLNSDKITTVSPSYAKEIQTKEFGCNLESILQSRECDLVGILNGIDTSIWNSKTDKLITKNFDVNSLENKEENKKALELENFGKTSDKPLFSMVTRLASQKGIDYLLPSIENALKDLDCNIIVVGTGDKEYEQKLLELNSIYDNLSVHIKFSNTLAHKVEAGSDFFLMPSLYEPCGLNQMYSLCYATLVLASNVGGLKDTIIDSYNGFIIDKVNSDSIFSSMKRACDLYLDKKEFNKKRENAIKCDFSWKNNCKKYIEVYRSLR